MCTAVCTSSKDLIHRQTSIICGLVLRVSQVLCKTSAGSKLGCPVRAKYSRYTTFHQHPHLFQSFCALASWFTSTSFLNHYLSRLPVGPRQHPGTRDWENRFQLHAVIRKTLVYSRMSRCLAKKRIICFDKQYSWGEKEEWRCNRTKFICQKLLLCSSSHLPFVGWRAGSWWNKGLGSLNKYSGFQLR